MIDFVTSEVDKLMRSSKINLNTNKLKTQFPLSLYASHSELYFAENPIKIKHTVPEIGFLVMLKTIKYKEN